MRVGLMVGPERGRYRTKIDRLQADAVWAEEHGLHSVWIPQIPDELDAMTAAAVVGMVTSRIEVGTAVVPVQPRHPIALAQQALSVQAICDGRFTLGLGVSHHWIVEEMLGLSYEQPVATMRATLDVLDQALAGPGTVVVTNERFTVRQPLDVTDVTPTPVLLAALGPRMLALCGERAGGTILWMADERAIAEHVVPTLTRAAASAGRPAPRVVAGVPVCVCTDAEVPAAVDRANRILSEAEISPNYQRLLEHGDARQVGDILAAGGEGAVEHRLQRFADAGVTDLSVRVVPIGSGREALLASLRRTREFLADLARRWTPVPAGGSVPAGSAAGTVPAGSAAGTLGRS